MFHNGVMTGWIMADVFRCRIAQDGGGIGFGGARPGAKFARERLRQADGERLCHTGTVTQGEASSQGDYDWRDGFNSDRVDKGFGT